MRPLRHSLLNVGLALVAVQSSSTGTVSAGDDAQTAVPTSTTTLSPIQSCIRAAADRRLAHWVCTGASLTIPAAHPNIAAPSPGTVGTAIQGDDFDYWCENGSSCTRRISNYISETKGNVAYGNETGAIGQFDVILRTTLNGRQAQWTLSIDHDTGPPLSMYLEVACLEDEDILWDSIGFGAPGFHLEISADDVDLLHTVLTEAGMRPTGPPQDRPWGERTFNVVDPDGNHIEFAGG